MSTPTFLKAAPESAKPEKVDIRFPFRLKPRMTLKKALRHLKTKKITQCDFSDNGTGLTSLKCSIDGLIAHKTFVPNAVVLEFQKDRLVNVTLLKEGIPNCVSMVKDYGSALDFMTERYHLDSPQTVNRPPSDSSQCGSYVDRLITWLGADRTMPGPESNYFWDGKTPDYLALTGVYREDKGYRVYLRFTHVPSFQGRSSPHG